MIIQSALVVAALAGALQFVREGKTSSSATSEPNNKLPLPVRSTSNSRVLPAIPIRTTPKPRVLPPIRMRSSAPKPRVLPPVRPKRTATKRTPVANPLKTLIDTLTSTLGNLTSSIPFLNQDEPMEDISAQIEKLLPVEAKIITPEYPQGIRKVQLEDLNNDGHDEAVVTYDLDGDMITAIFKKADDNWVKAAEVKNTGYNKLHYVHFADVNGDGKPEILVGWRTDRPLKDLHIFSWTDQDMQKVASEKYDRMEVNYVREREGNAIAELALWRPESDGGYAINLVHLNGSEFAHSNDVTSYYYERVVPFYAQKVRESGDSPYHWYYFSDSLVKAKMPKDALMAIDTGMSREPNSSLRENFLSLRETSLNMIKR